MRAEGGSSSRTSRQRDSGATSSRRISTATSSRTIATISTQYTSRLSMGVTSSPLPVASSSLNIVPASTAGRRLSSRSGPSSSSGTITTVSSQLSIVACGKAVRRMQAARLQALPGRAAIPRNSFHWPGGSSSVIISCEALTSQPEMHGLLRLTEIPSSLRTFPPGFYVASTGMEQWLSPG